MFFARFRQIGAMCMLFSVFASRNNIALPFHHFTSSVFSCQPHTKHIHMFKVVANDVLGIIKFNLAQQLVQVKSEKVHETILRAKPSRNTTHTVSLSLSHQAENKIPTAIRVVQLKLTTQMYTDIPKQTQIERASFWIEKRKNSSVCSSLLCSCFLRPHENVRTWQLNIKIKKAKDMTTSVTQITHSEHRRKSSISTERNIA